MKRISLKKTIAVVTLLIAVVVFLFNHKYTFQALANLVNSTKDYSQDPCANTDPSMPNNGKCRYLINGRSNRPYFTAFTGGVLGNSNCGPDNAGICLYTEDSNFDPECDEITLGDADHPYSQEATSGTNTCTAIFKNQWACCTPKKTQNPNQIYGQDRCNTNSVVNSNRCYYTITNRSQKLTRTYMTGNLCDAGKGVCLYGFLDKGNSGSGVTCPELINQNNVPYKTDAAGNSDCTQPPSQSPSSYNAICCAPPSPPPVPTQPPHPIVGPCPLNQGAQCSYDSSCTSLNNSSTTYAVDTHFSCSPPQVCCIPQQNQCAAYGGTCKTFGPNGPQDCTDLGQVDLGGAICGGNGSCCVPKQCQAGGTCFGTGSCCTNTTPPLSCTSIGTTSPDNTGTCFACTPLGHSCTTDAECCQSSSNSSSFRAFCDPNTHTCTNPAPSPTPPISGTGQVFPPEPSSPPPPCEQLDPAGSGKCLSVSTGLGSIKTDPSNFVSSIFGILLSISGAIAILIIMFAGYRLMMSQGDPEKIQEAKELITAAIVGLLFLIFCFVILSVIGVDLLHLPGFSG